MSWEDSAFLNWRLAEKENCLAKSSLKWSFGNSFLLQFCEFAWLLQNIISLDSWNINASKEFQKIGCLKLLKNQTFICQQITEKAILLLLDKKTRNFLSTASFLWQKIIKNTEDFCYEKRFKGELYDDLFYNRANNFSEIVKYFQLINDSLDIFLKQTKIEQIILREKFIDYNYQEKVILLYISLVFIDKNGIVNVILYEKNLDKMFLFANYLQDHFSVLPNRIAFAIISTEGFFLMKFSDIVPNISIGLKVKNDLLKSYDLLFEKIIPEKMYSKKCQICKFMGYCFPEKLSKSIQQRIERLSAKSE